MARGGPKRRPQRLPEGQPQRWPERRPAQRPAQRPARRRSQPPLDDLALHLRHIRSVVLVAIAALRRQNCELDEDIARLLQRCVCDRIDDQIERLEAGKRAG